MAIFTTGTWLQTNKHMVARSSKIKASDTGHIYDLVFAAARDNGTNAKVGAYLNTGLQERTGTNPATTDQIVFVCDVPTIARNYTINDRAEYNFENPANKGVRCYELVKDDVFGVSDYGFTTVLNSTTGPVKGSKVVVDGSGKWVELISSTATATLENYGFVGTIIGFETYQFDTVVLISVDKNEQL